MTPFCVILSLVFSTQRKLESEIEEMEDKFGTKRKKIMDNSQNFKLKIEEVGSSIHCVCMCFL